MPLQLGRHRSHPIAPETASASCLALGSEHRAETPTGCVRGLTEEHSAHLHGQNVLANGLPRVDWSGQDHSPSPGIAQVADDRNLVQLRREERQAVCPRAPECSTCRLRGRRRLKLGQRCPRLSLRPRLCPRCCPKLGCPKPKLGCPKLSGQGRPSGGISSHIGLVVIQSRADLGLCFYLRAARHKWTCALLLLIVEPLQNAPAIFSTQVCC
mmetsp:Transcript_96170/g.276279  ORF Transcript_96170/g.276279 Transcript_96170/m.276279 type:complete len:212 (-) Transcript_96170:1315-1950(-)